MISDIGDATVQAVRAALDRASANHMVIAHNIANANTEGYTSVRTSFDGLLNAHKEKINSASAGTVADRGEAKLLDRMNLDAEVARLSQNVVYYQALLRGLSAKMRTLELAITEGRR